MKDPIERQAAIEAVSKGCQECRGIFGMCEENILALPSAQPEIIRCRDCRHYAGGGLCGLSGIEGWHDDDYCSYAERREVSE